MNLTYIIKEGILGIKRAKFAAFTSIFSLFVAILLLGILSRISYNFYMHAMSFRELIEIEIFLFDIDERTTNSIEQTLDANSIVLEYVYISKDSASSIMRQEFGSGVEDLVALNFLPASFKVKVDTELGIDQVTNFASTMLTEKGVDEVKYNEGLLKVMESNLAAFNFIGGGIGLLILFVSVILVYNTIRLTIYAKRELIRAMKLVGATNGFIRSPFIIEGMIQGIIAGSISVASVYVIFEYVLPFFLPEMGILEWPLGRWYFLVTAMFSLSILMGWLGSRFAARKFIKETYISG
jgi:cell division transport system permease protein